MTTLDSVVEHSKRAHCTEEERAMRGPRRGNYTLCEFCDRCGRSQCEWDGAFQPVPGWNAEQYAYQFWRGKDNKRQLYTDSYRVLDCPKFREG